MQIYGHKKLENGFEFGSIPETNIMSKTQNPFCILVFSYHSQNFAYEILKLHIHYKFKCISIPQFNSVYWPIKGPQGATGKLYIDE